MDNIYGKIINKYRTEMKLTQAELGQKLGVSANCISAWEIGRNEPNMGAVCKMAEIFHCSVSDMMGRQNSWEGSPVKQDFFVESLGIVENDNEERLLRLYRKLNSGQQHELINKAIDLLTK